MQLSWLSLAVKLAQLAPDLGAMLLLVVLALRATWSSGAAPWTKAAWGHELEFEVFVRACPFVPTLRRDAGLARPDPSEAVAAPTGADGGVAELFAPIQAFDFSDWAPFSRPLGGA